MEGCLAEMEQANINLAKTFRFAQDKLFAEDKALSKKRLASRLRAQIPEEQAKVTDKKTGKKAKEEDLDGPAK